MAGAKDLSFDDLPSGGGGSVRALSFDDIASRPLSPMEGARAFSSGVNRAALAQVPGLPVKVALDLADLARAGYGYAGGKLGLLDAAQMPEPLDRSQYVGSPEWIAQQIERTEPGRAAIMNPRPDNASARLLNAGGQGMGGMVTGNPRDAAMQFASGIAGQGAIEAGASPEWAMVAGMAPQMGVTGSAELTRRAMRGGEAGRQEMAARLAEFERAGVDPTVGLATGNRRTQAVEAALSKLPGGAGVMAQKVEGMQDQLGAAASAARDRVSTQYGPIAAGQAAKEGIQQYRERQQAMYGQMQDRALAMVPEGMQFPADSMMARGAATLADIPGAPNVSRTVNKPLGFTQEVLGALREDVAPRPAANVPSSILRDDGQPFMQDVPGSPGGIGIGGLRELKGRIGQLAYANDNPLMADANTGALKNLYGGAKADLMRAGELADVERMAQGQHPGVARRFAQADRFYTQTQTVLEKILTPIHRAGDPASEKAYFRIESDARNSGKTVQRIMGSLPLEARRQVTATVIDRLGKAAPGQQNAEGSQFSPQTFLGNWNRLAPEAKGGLLSGIPAGATVRARLDSIAKSASMMRDANKVYSNPSGTAQAVNVTGMAAGLASGGIGMATGNVAHGASVMGTVLGSMAAANWSARLMTNSKFVTWLANATQLPEGRALQHLRRLSLNATAEKDPQARADLETFTSELASELGAQGQ